MLFELGKMGWEGGLDIPDVGIYFSEISEHEPAEKDAGEGANRSSKQHKPHPNIVSCFFSLKSTIFAQAIT